MLRRTIVTLAIVAAIAAVPALAAAGSSAQKPEQKPAEKMSGEKPMQKPEDRPGQSNFGTLISSLNNLDREISDLQARKNLTARDVQIVSVADLTPGGNKTALDNALSRNSAQVTELGTAIAGNEVLTSYLSTNKIAPARVIAIDVPTTGQITLFVQPASVP